MFNRSVNILFIILSALTLGGCATWSTATVKPLETATTLSAPSTKTVLKTPNEILITENDITDRPYDTLGEISVTVNKTTIFHPDPTPALVNTKLQEKASEMTADAVVLVRYGTVGISMMSWGSLDGKGRAVRFRK